MPSFVVSSKQVYSKQDDVDTLEAPDTVQRQRCINVTWE